MHTLCTVLLCPNNKCLKMQIKQKRWFYVAECISTQIMPGRIMTVHRNDYNSPHNLNRIKVVLNLALRAIIIVITDAYLGN